MKYIFVDFEMHPVANHFKEVKRNCKNEIIQIGAVMLDENFQEISSFKKYVKPKYSEVIYPQISMLTGITQDMISSAGDFNVVFKKFVAWCGEYDSNYTVYAWSKHDLLQLKNEMKIKDIKVIPQIECLLHNWRDFQKEYCSLIRVDKPISLENALNLIGKEFIGKVHDALWDARNTAELFVETQDEDRFFDILQSIKDVLYAPEETVKLGDIFNFKLVYSA